LKFKPRAFEGKIRYETTGKITRKVNFPVPQTADSTFVAIIALELLNVLDEGVMELSFFNEKATYIVGGNIKEVPFNGAGGKVSLCQDGEITFLEGEPAKTGIKGTLIFPQRFLSIGDSWENSMTMELPCFADPLDFIVRSTLEKFELYGEEKICAVINNILYPIEETKAGKFQGKEIIYFDYELGRMIKSILKMRIVSNIFGITFDLQVNTTNI